MLHRVALLAIVAPRRVLGLAALLMVAAAVFGVPVAKTLSAGGFQDPASESSRATALLTDKFGQGDVQLLFMVTVPDDIRGSAARAEGLDIVTRSRTRRMWWMWCRPWTAPPQAATTCSVADGRSGLIVAGVSGGQKAAPGRAQALSMRWRCAAQTPRCNGVGGRLGDGVLADQLSDRAGCAHDGIDRGTGQFCGAFWVFGGLVAAALPVVVGGLAIVGPCRCCG